MLEFQENKINHHTFAKADQTMEKIVMKAAPGMDGLR